MNCRTAKDRALARRDTPLSARQEAEWQAHLGACRSCARHWRQMETALGWVGELPIAEPSANFEWRLRLRLSKLEKESSVPASETRPLAIRWPVQFLGSAAAAAAVVLALGFLLVPRLASRQGGSPVAPLVVTAPPGAAPSQTPAFAAAPSRGARLELTGGRGSIGPRPAPSPEILVPMPADSVAPEPLPPGR